MGMVSIVGHDIDTQINRDIIGGVRMKSLVYCEDMRLSDRWLVGRMSMVSVRDD